jgi:hypothetical protein
MAHQDLIEGPLYWALRSANIGLLLRSYHQAHQRYLSAIRSLVQVQRLGAQVVQVNIGNQQVNMTG